MVGIGLIIVCIVWVCNIIDSCLVDHLPLPGLLDVRCMKIGHQKGGGFVSSIITRNAFFCCFFFLGGVKYSVCDMSFLRGLKKSPPPQGLKRCCGFNLEVSHAINQSGGHSSSLVTGKNLMRIWGFTFGHGYEKLMLPPHLRTLTVIAETNQGHPDCHRRWSRGQVTWS